MEAASGATHGTLAKAKAAAKATEKYLVGQGYKKNSDGTLSRDEGLGQTITRTIHEATGGNGSYYFDHSRSNSTRAVSAR